MKVIVCQLDIVWENKPANYRKVEGLLESARVGSGSLILLPEMFSTGFSMNVERIYEPDPSPTLEFVSGLARSYRSHVLAGWVSRAYDGRGRNEAHLIDPEGQSLMLYQKMQPFSLAGETAHYLAGEQPFVMPLNGFHLSPFICYDLRFPEHFRKGVSMGADLFAVIANWPSVRVEHWITLLRARAIENLAYVVGVNRCGDDPERSYPGRSMIVDPKGEIIADAGTEERVLEGVLDLEGVKEWREKFPALRDIRKAVPVL